MLGNRRSVLGSLCLAGVIGVLGAFALGLAPFSSVSETWVYTGWLSKSRVSDWASVPGSRAYHLKMQRPDTEELRALLDLPRATALLIESESYPERADLPLWNRIARTFPSYTLRLFDLQLPDAETIDILNQTGAPNIEFILTYFPDTDEGERLSLLRSSVAVEFRTPRYPRYDEIEILLAIPAHVKLTFVAGIWPWYHQMDIFNMIPHTKKLRVVDGFYPSEYHWDYLANIRDLEETTVVSDYAPPEANDWKRFGDQMRLVWVYRNGLPLDHELRPFEQSSAIQGSRRLVLDSDFEPTQTERERLRSVKIPVEWKRSAPIQ